MAGLYGTNLRAPKVNIHDFSMVPRADIPRSTFMMQHQHKTTFNMSYLVPIYLQEVLPGDSFHVKCSAFARLATPLYPIMDNIDLETFFFFVPNRLVWTHWEFFCGAQNNPADSITYSIPQIVSPVNGFPQLSVYDYFGLPTAGQTAVGNTISVSALPIRAYSLIWSEWFRDQNLQNYTQTGTAGSLAAGAHFQFQSDDGPDTYSNYAIYTVGKRHDYFTSCLPWTQKGGGNLNLFTGAQATVKASATDLLSGAQNPLRLLGAVAGTNPGAGTGIVNNGTGIAGFSTAAIGTYSASVYPSNLYADLGTATTFTINALRLSFQTQRLLERDARGGTRYAEHVLTHWGVRTDDLRLGRPEYLGGGKTPVNIAPVPQTATFSTTPLGTLAAAATAGGQAGFSYNSKEHGYILGLVCARNDKVYQQGIRALWKRNTRYDFYMPVFAHIGEQPVFNREIYSDGSVNDNSVFGYQEAWASYRYHPSRTSAYFRSTTTTPLDSWHLAQKFTSLPALNATFINDDLITTYQRVAAAGASSANQQILADFFFSEKVARAMPMYSVPGLIDHF